MTSCEHCGKPIESVSATGVGQYVAGWAENRTGGGTHALALQERFPRFVHRHCLKLMRDGISADQERLL